MYDHTFLLKELTETHEKTDQRFNNAALTDFLQDLHQLADPKLASPVSSIANWFDLVKKISKESSWSLNEFDYKLNS